MSFILLIEISMLIQGIIFVCIKFEGESFLYSNDTSVKLNFVVVFYLDKSLMVSIFGAFITSDTKKTF